MKRKPVVWVTQETDVDFSEAERYGEVKFLTANDFNNTRSSIKNQFLLMSLRKQLTEFEPENDWIVITGSPIVSCAVFAILGWMRHPLVRILRWDNRDLVYRPHYLELNKETSGERIQ
jgi:hypothetical protein